MRCQSISSSVEDKGWEYRYGQLEVEPTEPGQHTREWSAAIGANKRLALGAVIAEQGGDLIYVEPDAACHCDELEASLNWTCVHGIAGRELSYPELIRLAYQVLMPV